MTAGPGTVSERQPRLPIRWQEWHQSLCDASCDVYEVEGLSRRRPSSQGYANVAAAAMRKHCDKSETVTELARHSSENSLLNDQQY